MHIIGQLQTELSSYQRLLAGLDTSLEAANLPPNQRSLGGMMRRSLMEKINNLTHRINILQGQVPIQQVIVNPQPILVPVQPPVAPAAVVPPQAAAALPQAAQPEVQQPILVQVQPPAAPAAVVPPQAPAVQQEVPQQEQEDPARMRPGYMQKLREFAVENAVPLTVAAGALVVAAVAYFVLRKAPNSSTINFNGPPPQPDADKPTLKPSESTPPSTNAEDANSEPPPPPLSENIPLHLGTDYWACWVAYSRMKSKAIEFVCGLSYAHRKTIKFTVEIQHDAIKNALKENGGSLEKLFKKFSWFTTEIYYFIIGDHYGNGHFNNDRNETVDLVALKKVIATEAEQAAETVTKLAAETATKLAAETVSIPWYMA